MRVVQVAAAHRHSAALSSAGELYTWGANGEGQLGYGTSDSACNPTPRLVDALRVSKTHTDTDTHTHIHTRIQVCVSAHLVIVRGQVTSAHVCACVSMCVCVTGQVPHNCQPS